MTSTEWILLIAIIVYISLMAVGVKYPRTREHWTKERKETFQILMSATVFLMLFFMLWYVSASVDWPDGVLVTFWVCVFTFAGLVLAGIFAPQGIKLRFEKKKEAKAANEDDD
jgi:protein-S-isoprenylcysteine O-methyltransferase Ste14